MAPLDTSLRNQLEKAIVAARDMAEAGAKAALERLAVDADQPFASMSPDERELRRQLRAKARQLGGSDALLAECAYEHWHRMLFARFLAENSLLMHPTGVPVTLEECDELAPDEGAADGWELAARYASRMLPQIFRTDDPVLQVRLAPEHVQGLEALLDQLPVTVFADDDSIGWVYQYWQSKKKDEVNASEEKISGKNIGPVTQLFTEPYMVQFLLHNTLGAWWLSRHQDEALPIEMPYLRTLEDGTPAAGVFEGWPDTASEITVMDPCCGSGHFLVAAFEIMQRFRMAEEGLSEREAGDAVLRDNLFGLEIDPRCTQIAAFALAFAAWKSGGYRELPALNVACSGQSLRGKRDDWVALANGDEKLVEGMGQLYDLFEQAPDLGSLIDPQKAGAGSLLSANFGELQPLLEQALRREAAQNDENIHFAGIAAQGLAKAAELLANMYHFVATNVPYLNRKRQHVRMSSYIGEHYSAAKNDLSTTLIVRASTLCEAGGVVAAVTTQNWLFLSSYTKFRREMLAVHSWLAVARLGPGAFETISGHVVDVVLVLMRRSTPTEEHQVGAVDASMADTPVEKASLLRSASVEMFSQRDQLANPDARLLLDALSNHPPLTDFARVHGGICTGDNPRFHKEFWELPAIGGGWIRHKSATSDTSPSGGCSLLLLWEDGNGTFHRTLRERLGEFGVGAWIRGEDAWDRRGVAVSRMGDLPSTLYHGEAFDQSLGVIVPLSEQLLPAVWAFCSSAAYAKAVRQLDRKVNVTHGTFVKVPFDLEHWRKIADEAGPLPEPYSEDPTQWLFDGNPARTTEPLQVAVARLLSYHWPDQETNGLEDLADKDGVVCLQSVHGEPPAADRLAALLTAAYGDEWTAATQAGLLAAVGFEGKSLTDWLREGFFKQHCKLFHQRPFIWHIWDGRKDGFSALVNYHKLDRALLTRITYSYLGDWITRQRHADDQGVSGANARLVAAEELSDKLKLIIKGEDPFDIFVRWKPLHEQPIGWEPDLNDGVRLNIRPFMEAGILRAKPSIKWNKDRGKNPPGSPWGDERINDKRLSLAEKREARKEAGEPS